MCVHGEQAQTATWFCCRDHDAVALAGQEQKTELEQQVDARTSSKTSITKTTSKKSGAKKTEAKKELTTEEKEALFAQQVIEIQEAQEEKEAKHLALLRNRPPLVVADATLAIACHSGLHVKDCTTNRGGWAPTVALLAQANVPTVFTAFTRRNMDQAALALAALDMNVVQAADTNPFRGLRPFPEPFNDNSFYYSNGFWLVARGATEAVPLNAPTQPVEVKLTGVDGTGSNDLVEMSELTEFSLSQMDDGLLPDWITAWRQEPAE
jgi:hypothetical protein